MSGIGDVIDDLLSGAEDDELEDMLEGVDDDDDDEEMLEGYGDQIVGAARRRRRRGGRRRVSAKGLNRLAIGIGSTSIAATTSAVVTVTPQLPFRLERFVSPATGLLITDIKVGTNSQFVGSGSIPIEVFAANSVGVALRGDTAVPGVDIALGLSNPTAGALAASGAYIGYAAGH